jgi:hypothetical protein
MINPPTPPIPPRRPPTSPRAGHSESKRLKNDSQVRAPMRRPHTLLPVSGSHRAASPAKPPRPPSRWSRQARQDGGAPTTTSAAAWSWSPVRPSGRGCPAGSGSLAGHGEQMDQKGPMEIAGTTAAVTIALTPPWPGAEGGRSVSQGSRGTAARVRLRTPNLLPWRGRSLRYFEPLPPP